MKNLLKIHSTQWILLFLDTLAIYPRMNENKIRITKDKIGEYNKEVIRYNWNEKGSYYISKAYGFGNSGFTYKQFGIKMKKEQQCLDKK